MKSLSEQLLQTLERVVKSGLTKGFYLAGGTALALRYNHRVSTDLDFFSFSEAKINMEAIAQRGSKKDFYDLWFLMKKHGWKLEDFKKIAKAKFPSWNFGIFLKSITYFKDAEKRSYPDIDKDWSAIKKDFVKLVMENIRLPETPRRRRKGNHPSP